MGTPKFDVLAQMVVAPTGTPTTVYQPPAGRAGVLAGVRILMKFPKVDEAGGYIEPHPDYSPFMTAKNAQGEYLKIFDNNDYYDSTYNIAFCFEGKEGSFYHRTETQQKQWTDNKFRYSVTRSIFRVLVGNERVTGELTLPNYRSHMDVKVPVVSNRYPLKIVNGIFMYGSQIPNREQVIRNHYKRVSHLAVTVFGQEVDQ